MLIKKFKSEYKYKRAILICQIKEKKVNACLEWISKVKKIPSLGTFHENERMFAFEAILNEHKDCFSQFAQTCKKGDFHLPIDLFSL